MRTKDRNVAKVDGEKQAFACAEHFSYFIFLLSMPHSGPCRPPGSESTVRTKLWPPECDSTCRPSSSGSGLRGPGGGGSQKLIWGPLWEECGIHSQAASPKGARIQAPHLVNTPQTPRARGTGPTSGQKRKQASRDQGAGSAPPVTSALCSRSPLPGSAIRPHRPTA